MENEKMMRLRDVVDKLGIDMRTALYWVNCGALKGYKAHPTAKALYRRVDVQKIYDNLNPQTDKT